MDANTSIIVGCSLVLCFHLADSVARRLRIPSILLLLGLGMATRALSGSILPAWSLPDQILQTLGLVGLALIVLEGSMALRWRSDSAPTFLRASLSAALGLGGFLALAAPIFHWLWDVPWRLALLNATPLAVISSAIAIPSASRLPTAEREFVSIESSISDILGVVVFNALLLPQALGLATLGRIAWSSTLVAFASLALVAILFRMLRNSTHHVRFIPLLALILLFFALGKELHLPSLLLVFLFGLAFANLAHLRPGPLREWLLREEHEDDAKLLESIVAELAFLVRTFFFFLFGFSLDLTTLAQPAAWAAGAGTLSVVYLARLVALRLSRSPRSRTLLVIAPRGLITVLLMSMIPAAWAIPELADGPVLIVILGTTLALALGGRKVAEGASIPSLDEILPHGPFLPKGRAG